MACALLDDWHAQMPVINFWENRAEGWQEFELGFWSLASRVWRMSGGCSKQSCSAPDRKLAETASPLQPCSVCRVPIIIIIIIITLIMNITIILTIMIVITIIIIILIIIIVIVITIIIITIISVIIIISLIIIIRSSSVGRRHVAVHLAR